MLEFFSQGSHGQQGFAEAADAEAPPAAPEQRAAKGSGTRGRATRRRLHDPRAIRGIEPE